MARCTKILVAYDGSASAENALRQALSLASEEKCWVRVVTVVPPFEGELDLTGVGDVREAILRPARALIAGAAGIARESGRLVKASLEEGDISQRLADIAEEERCGLIVMGRRGKKKLGQALIGSVTARVIGLSGRDVLVVPQGTAIGWQRILVAVDGSPHGVAAAARAVELAAAYGGALTALGVVDVPDEYYAEATAAVDRMIALARGYAAAVAVEAQKAGVPCTPIVREGDAAGAIVKAAAEGRTELIVVGSHGRTGLARLLMGSVTEKVVGHAPCPVYVAKKT